MSALVVGALPLATVLAALVIPPISPHYAWAYIFCALSSLVSLGTITWGVILHSHVAEEARAQPAG